jgi:transposase
MSRISDTQRADIHRLFRAGLSARNIARRTGCSRTTVKRVLFPPKPKQTPNPPSSLDAPVKQPKPDPNRPTPKEIAEQEERTAAIRDKW